MNASDNQLAFIWHYWQFYEPIAQDKPKTDQKISLLTYFDIEHISDMTQEQADTYIKTTKPEYHSSVGYFELLELENDWAINAN